MAEAVCGPGIKLANPPKIKDGTITAACDSQDPNQVEITFMAKGGVDAKVPLDRVYAALQSFAKKSGLVLPSKAEIISKQGLDPKKPEITGAIIVLAKSPTERTSSSVIRKATPAQQIEGSCDVYTPSPETMAEMTKPSPQGPRYQITGDKQTRLESKKSYKIALSVSDSHQKEVQAQKREFALQIFKHLMAKGIIKSDISFKSVIGRSEGEKIFDRILSLIDDKDRDGHFDIDMKDLISAIGQEKGTARSVELAEVADALSTITNRYFEDRESEKVLEYYVKYGDSSTTRTNAQKRLNELRSAARVEKSVIERMSAGEFLRYIANTYKGKLCDNPELQRQFAKDMEAFMQSHFTSAETEDARQLMIDANFVLNPGNLQQLSRDGDGKYRVNCRLLADFAAMCFRSAGLQVKYIGSSSQAEDISHVQAVGYAKGFMIANDNLKVQSRGKDYTGATVRELVINMLAVKNNRDLVLSHGLNNTRQVSAFLSQRGHIITLQKELPQIAQNCPDIARLVPVNVDKSTLSGLKAACDKIDQLRYHAKQVAGIVTMTIDGKKQTFNQDQLLAYINKMEMMYTAARDKVAEMVG